MALVPDTKQGKVTFFRSKVAPWTASPTEIGTTAANVAAFDVLVSAAEDKRAAQTSAEGAFRAAVEEADQAVEAMAKAGADIISAVRTKGRTDSAVWALAQIPAPATPSPVGAPGTPSAMEVALNPNGSVVLSWDCANPAGSVGVIYHVYRQLEAVGDFTFVGGSGKKEFTDTTVPSGIATIVYKIQAVRSSAIGIDAEFIVRFGTAAGGAMTATVTAASPKLAA